MFPLMGSLPRFKQTPIRSEGPLCMTRKSSKLCVT